MKIFTVFMCFCCIFVTVVHSEKGYRLPLTVKPTSYSIKIQPNIDKNIFQGVVKIFLNVSERVNKITLHCKGLNIERIALDFQLEGITYKEYSEYEIIDIFHENNDEIPPGEHVLYIKYTGDLLISTTQDGGLRKVEYHRGKNIGYIIASDFEPNYARTTFPCFDEPSFKAKFSVRIVTPNNTYTALSNMKQITKIETPSGVIYDFQTSVTMSSYLVAFIMTDYPHREAIWNNNGVETPIRFYSPYAGKPENQFVLDTAIKCLDYFNNYTNIKFPLSKLDMIEYERKSGATENWGMITFRQGLLCPSEKQYDKGVIGDVICHEISHSWFGNLVTNYWWNDIWLHEGIADFMSTKSYDFEEADGTFQEMLEDDRGLKSYAISTQVHTRADIINVFGDITYKKGGAVLRMLENSIGEEKFKSAIRKYLEQHAYGSATTNDFIQAFESVVPEVNIRSFFITWLYQTDHPIINVSEDETNKRWVLQQIPSPGPEDGPDNERRQRWVIPVTYYTDVDKEVKEIWFDKDIDEFTIPMGNASWIKLNHGRVGIYQVNYSESLLHKLKHNFLSLDEHERKLLLLDLEILFNDGVIDCDILLDFIVAFYPSGRNFDLRNPALLVMYRLEGGLAYEHVEEMNLLLEFEFQHQHYDKDALRNKVKHKSSLLKEMVSRSNDEENAPKKQRNQRMQQCADWINNNLVDPEVNVATVR